VIGFGHTIVGACVSLTVTVNEHIAGLPDASLTVQVTVVTPFWKVDPDAGMHDGVPTPGQLSVAVAFLYVTTAEHRFGSVPCVIGDGQVIIGACVSLTVTVNEHIDEFFDASLTVQLTVVVPFANTVPDAGEHAGVPTPGQLSLTIGAA
jgi:hypothetical protein